jgi:hypothetical protein
MKTTMMETLPDIALLPPSDFRDLIHLLQQHFTSFTALSGRSPSDSSILYDLAKQRREIDTHYGWVLASDCALVGRTLSLGDAKDTKCRMQRIYTEYDRIREVLLLRAEDLEKQERMSLEKTS